MCPAGSLPGAIASTGPGAAAPLPMIPRDARRPRGKRFQESA